MEALRSIDLNSIKNHRFIYFLIKRFVKSPNDATDTQIRSGVGKLSGCVGIFCNLILSASKLVVGIMSSSMSITADALNNLSDAASSILTLIGFKLAEKPADSDHPYGHARFEYLSGLLVSIIIILIGFELAKGSITKMLNPTSVEFSAVTTAVLVFSMILKLWLFFFNKALSSLIDSTTLLATALDSRNDVLTTGAVLLASVIELFTSFKIDSFMGLAVAIFILISGAKLAKETISPLLGEATNPVLRDEIHKFITSAPLVLGCHDLMVHDYGPGQCFASLHVEMDKDEDPLVCHDLIDNLERDCFEKFGVHLVIHYDPIIVNNPRLNLMKEKVTEILRSKDERITIHDFRMVEGPTHTNLIFDVVLPEELAEDSDKIKAELDTALNCGSEKFETVIIFDSEAFN